MTFVNTLAYNLLLHKENKITEKSDHLFCPGFRKYLMVNKTEPCVAKGGTFEAG